MGEKKFIFQLSMAGTQIPAAGMVRSIARFNPYWRNFCSRIFSGFF